MIVTPDNTIANLFTVSMMIRLCFTIKQSEMLNADQLDERRATCSSEEDDLKFEHTHYTVFSQSTG